MAARKRIRQISRLLVANRGEIAARILIACREARIPSVAIFSEADRNAPYLHLADQVVCIGPGPAAQSYLDADRILGAGRSSGADAIHPGYGFLSESCAFAARCAEEGIIFIGPPVDVIRALGDKAGAKRIAAGAGVPIVPGYYGADQSNARLAAEAAALGEPIIIKAASGGGGRGMRVVNNRTQFQSQLDEARREAQAAFGDDTVLIERFLSRPRHIEVQIFGDAQGTVVALHERECSIQRRHQKILEESPSPALDADLRARMVNAAVRLGQEVGYRNAGTVEFLLDESGMEPQFYFLEVNTRLQVEHAVTEMRTGLDLVRLQIDVAAGQPTPALTHGVAAFGHAIETRIYSEDPERGFAPSLGTLAHWIEPRGPGVRVDSGVERGSEVTPFYDPMLAKLIVHASTRSLAIDRLESALSEFHVIGVDTNIDYLLAIVRDPEFRAGETHVRFLEERLRGWRSEREVPDEVLVALAAEQLCALPAPKLRVRAESESIAAGPTSAWGEIGRWRNV